MHTATAAALKLSRAPVVYLPSMLTPWLYGLAFPVGELVVGRGATKSRSEITPLVDMVPIGSISELMHALYGVHEKVAQYGLLGLVFEAMPMAIACSAELAGFDILACGFVVGASVGRLALTLPRMAIAVWAAGVGFVVSSGYVAGTLLAEGIVRSARALFRLIPDEGDPNYDELLLDMNRAVEWFERPFGANNVEATTPATTGVNAMPDDMQPAMVDVEFEPVGEADAVEAAEQRRAPTPFPFDLEPQQALRTDNLARMCDPGGPGGNARIRDVVVDAMQARFGPILNADDSPEANALVRRVADDFIFDLQRYCQNFETPEELRGGIAHVVGLMSVSFEEVDWTPAPLLQMQTGRFLKFMMAFVDLDDDAPDVHERAVQIAGLVVDSLVDYSWQLDIQELKHGLDQLQAFMDLNYPAVRWTAPDLGVTAAA